MIPGFGLRSYDVCKGWAAECPAKEAWCPMMSNKNVQNPPPIDVLGGFSPFQRQEPGSTAQGKLHLEPPPKKSAGNAYLAYLFSYASASQLPPRGISALVAVSEMVSRMGDIKYLAKHGQTLRGQPLCIAERLDSLYHVVSFVMVQPCSTGNQFNTCSSWAVEAHMWNSYSS